MKSIKTIALAATLVVAGTVASNAQNRLHFTGSTAYRGPTINAIHNIFDQTSLAYAYAGSSETGAGAAVYSGNINGVPYIIKTYWTGSEAGIQSVFQQPSGVALNFLQDAPYKGGSAQPLVIGSPVSGVDDPTSGGTGPFSSVVPNVAMCDTYSVTSQFHAAYNGQTYNGQSPAFISGGPGAGVVGVNPFLFISSSNADFTNINADDVQSLYTNGQMPAAFITGSAADQTNIIYAIGRNPDSGTRLTAFAESGRGALANTTQFEPLAGASLVTATASTITSLVPWPNDTVNGVVYNQPDSGYNSGGKVAAALGSFGYPTMVVYNSAGTATGTGGVLVAYVGTSDAATAESAHAIPLSYNGVAESTTAIESGQYTFWGYEHMYFLSSLSSTLKAEAEAIGVSILNTYALIPVSGMQVSRSADGGAITPTYAY